MKSDKLETIFSFEGYTKPKEVLVIGCGGTGAFVISHLSRYLSTFDLNDRIEFYISDGDIVEEKNLLRQHFIAHDIGKNKAEVLAERYSMAFGIEINYISSNIESLDGFPELKCPLIIGCVDNNATRKLIYNKSKASYHPIFWIDSGNEETNGQVICGYFKNSYYYKEINPQLTTHTTGGVFNLPSVIEIYPEILNEEHKFNSQLSCAERVISSPQNMMTNVTAATLVMNYAQRVISGLSLKSHGVEFSIKNSFQTRFNTKENLSLIKNRGV